MKNSLFQRNLEQEREEEIPEEGGVLAVWGQPFLRQDGGVCETGRAIWQRKREMSS